MGPGWTNFLWFTAPGVVPFKAVDNLDGSYTATLPFAGAVAPPVSVHFEDVVAIIPDSTTPDKLPQPLGPENVLTAIPPPCCLGSAKIAVFLDAGAGIPHGAFASGFNTGFSLNAGLEYIATNHFSAEGIFGYHHFPANAGSALDLYQFSANGKVYLNGSGPVRLFVNAGPGGYKFSPGSTYFGGNVGAGILYELTAHWGIKGSYNFHAIGTPVTAKFSDFELGIRYQF
jgi:opacity protein-like surface antigen